MQALLQTTGTLPALMRLCFIAAIWLFATVSIGSDHTARIGVLSLRDIDATRQQWAPLAEHLTQQISGRRFELVPLHLDDLNIAVEGGKIDFVLTQPEHYVMLRTRHGKPTLKLRSVSSNGPQNSSNQPKIWRWR